MAFVAARFAMLVWISTWLCSNCSEDHHHGHDDHGGHANEKKPWEWAGAYHLEEGETYLWSAVKKASGSYADLDMKMVVISQGNSTPEIHDAETRAETLWNSSNWTHLYHGTETTLSGSGTYQLNFNNKSWASMFLLTVPADRRLSGDDHHHEKSYVLFTQHAPTEFENGFHFLKAPTGADIEALEQEPASIAPTTTRAPTTTKKKDWPLVIGATLVTTLPALLMILVVGPLVSYFDSIPQCIHALAAGALGGAAFFLLLPEALHMTGAGNTEAESMAMWGSCILLGWLVACILRFVSTLIIPSGAEDAMTNKETTEQEVVKPSGLGMDWTVIAPVLFGDFWHNLTDGMVIGFAINFCSSSRLWAIVGATIIHETSQELADFFVLVKKGRMKWTLALISNYLSSLGVIFGACLAHEYNISQNSQGCLLAFGAGVYIFVSFTELGPDIAMLQGTGTKAKLDACLRVVGFVLGGTAIGLVLLDHEHCSAPKGVTTSSSSSSAGSHAGHNH